jgi:hypothetical protein
MVPSSAHWRSDYKPDDPEYTEEADPESGVRRVIIRTPWDYVILESYLDQDVLCYSIRDREEIIGMVDEAGTTKQPLHVYLIDALKYLSWESN